MPTQIVSTSRGIRNYSTDRAKAKELIDRLEAHYLSFITALVTTEKSLAKARSIVAEHFEFLNIILKNANRMSRLTEDLLALATIESPDYKLKRRSIKASALVEDAIESLAGMVGDAGMEMVASPATPSVVVADPDAMNQVFSNLIENALKYGRAGKRIEVGAHDLDEEVEFYVRDFGQGIAYEHLNRIFERFYRIDKARSRESGGTGLGLAIVKHVVQVQGGRIWAESELGQGATFHFTLRKPVLPDAIQEPQSSTPDLTPEEPAPQQVN